MIRSWQERVSLGQKLQFTLTLPYWRSSVRHVMWEAEAEQNCWEAKREKEVFVAQVRWRENAEGTRVLSLLTGHSCSDPRTSPRLPPRGPSQSHTGLGTFPIQSVYTFSMPSSRGSPGSLRHLLYYIEYLHFCSPCQLLTVSHLTQCPRGWPSLSDWSVGSLPLWLEVGFQLKRSLAGDGGGAQCPAMGLAQAGNI